MSLRKVFLALALLFLVGVWGACVDVPTGPGTNISPDFHSLTRFVNAIPGATGAVTVDGASIGTAAFGAPLGYTDILSGSRSITYAGGAAQVLGFTSEQQSTMLIYSTNATGGVGYLNMNEGHKDKNNGKADSVQIKFINASQGNANISFYKDTVASLLQARSFGTAGQYLTLAPGSFKIVARSGVGGDSTVVATATYGAGRMYTLVAAGSGTGFQVMTMEDRRAGASKPASSGDKQQDN